MSKPVKYALDTNILILLLRQAPNVCQKFNEAVDQGDELVIPALAHYEIKRGFRYKAAPAKESMYDMLTEQYPVGEIDTETLELAADIYASLLHAGRPGEDDDILIASFCIVYGYTLVTHNIRHFEGIERLEIEDWVE